MSVLGRAIPQNVYTDPRERYELLSKIGQGGYGYVCQAYDHQLNIPVAVKIINLDDAGEDIQDVHTEIAVMSSNIHCPQLTQYFASHVVDNEFWIIMEYVDAGSLLDIMKVRLYLNFFVCGTDRGKGKGGRLKTEKWICEYIW